MKKELLLPSPDSLWISRSGLGSQMCSYFFSSISPSCQCCEDGRSHKLVCDAQVGVSTRECTIVNKTYEMFIHICLWLTHIYYGSGDHNSNTPAFYSATYMLLNIILRNLFYPTPRWRWSCHSVVLILNSIKFHFILLCNYYCYLFFILGYPWLYSVITPGPELRDHCWVLDGMQSGMAACKASFLPTV